MSATNKVRGVRGAEKRQYGFIAQERFVGDMCAAVGARKSDADVTRRGFSRSARMWHRYTDGGVPICDVCRRVGHVARSCWQKTSKQSRRVGCGESVVHSVGMLRCDSVERRITVSVNAQQVEALLDFNALNNAVSFETVKENPKLKVYYFQEGETSSRCRSGALGVVWLPVVVGSRADKLRCVVVDGLKEKLIIGLPGLSFLGASFDFATGDVHIHRRRRRKVSDTTLEEGIKEMSEVHALVRDARISDTQSRKSPEGCDKCTRSLLSEQVKDLAKEDRGLPDADRGKRGMPNQEKRALVSGRGRKERKVNVVSPKHEMLSKHEVLNTVIPDHDEEESEGESDSGVKDASELEQLKTCGTGNAKAGKRGHKAKHKNSKKNKKKKKGKRRK